MGVREQICMNDSVKLKVNLILICCMCERVCVCVCVHVWCGFVGRTQTSSDERKCEQVDPLLAGPRHHMEVLDTRYHMESA